MFSRCNATTRIAVTLLFSAACFEAFGANQSAFAQTQADFPTKPIRVIVPYPPGGIVDIATRIVTEKLSQRLGQPIVVEPKPGGNANLGTDLAARAAPDGYNWSFIGPATLANPHIYTGLSWSEKSFTGVGVTVWAPFAIVVNPNSPANTISEFIELAKKSPPGTLNANCARMS